MRRRIEVRRPISSKPGSCTERCGVDPTGISVKVSAQYPGRAGGLPQGYRHREVSGKDRQQSAEAIVGTPRTEGPNMRDRQ